MVVQSVEELPDPLDELEPPPLVSVELEAQLELSGYQPESGIVTVLFPHKVELSVEPLVEFA